MPVLFDRRALMPGCAVAALLTLGTAAQQSSSTPPNHAKAVRRLVLQNAMIIYGNAKPPYGPMDVLVQETAVPDLDGRGPRLRGQGRPGHDRR